MPLTPRHVPARMGHTVSRFGNAMLLSPATRMFSFFESSYEPGFIFLSKIFGNALPRIGITRNREERKEVAFNESTQTAAFFLALPILSRLFNPVQGSFAGLSAAKVAMRNEAAFARTGGLALQKLKLAKLGKSMGVYSIIMALMIAMPYIRNWRTIKATGFSDYKQIVSSGGKRKPTPEERRQAETVNRKNVTIIKGLLGVGVLSAVGAMAVTGALVRNPGKIFSAKGFFNPKRLDALVKDWALVGRQSDQVMMLTKSRKPTLWVWGIPSFIGWFLGCRDGYEFAEQSSKFLTFLLGYMTVPVVMKKYMERRDAELLSRVKRATGKTVLPTYLDVVKRNLIKSPGLRKRYLSHLNTKNGMSLLVNLVVVGALPVIFNIFFSSWRMKKEAQKKGAAQPIQQPTVLQPLQWPKPLEMPFAYAPAKQSGPYSQGVPF